MMMINIEKLLKILCKLLKYITKISIQNKFLISRCVSLPQYKPVPILFKVFNQSMIHPFLLFLPNVKNVQLVLLLRSFLINLEILPVQIHSSILLYKNQITMIVFNQYLMILIKLWKTIHVNLMILYVQKQSHLIHYQSILFLRTIISMRKEIFHQNDKQVM